MNFFKSHFKYNKYQRNGIFVLVVLIISLQLIIYFINFSPKKNTSNLSEAELKAFTMEMDSLQKDKLQRHSIKIFPFNPNYITDFKGYQLGMSLKEIDKLLALRNSGGFVNSAKEFQNATGVSDSLLKVISLYFKFPKWVLKKRSTKDNKNSKNIKVKDINSATVSDFKKVYGIGEKLAERIVKYRNKLQGFSYNSQLYEVWYLDKEVADRVLKKFQVKKLPAISKIDINNATVRKIAKNVYIKYDLAKKIISYRDEVAEIQSIEELKKIDGFPLDKFNLIALYLKAN